MIQRSIKTNLALGVEAVEEALLAERARSCGQVTVAFCKAMVLSCSSAGGTDETSAPRRYFSIRRRETMLCDPSVRCWKQVLEAGSYLQHIYQGLRDRVQRELHLVKDFSDQQGAYKMLRDDSLATDVKATEGVRV